MQMQYAVTTIAWIPRASRGTTEHDGKPVYYAPLSLPDLIGQSSYGQMHMTPAISSLAPVAFKRANGAQDDSPG